jgi:cyclase
MIRPRIIPTLLIKNRELVKTRKFKSPAYVGDAINAIRIFNDKEVDELSVLDIGAARDGRAPDFEFIELIAAECFMPLCYGGGIRNVEDAQRLFDLGIEKITLQTAALESTSLITSIAHRFGSQSVVISIDIKRDWLLRYQLYESRTGKTLRRDWLSFIRDVVNAGAGEVVLNAVERDGELCGYDLELIEIASQEVTVPVVAIGGARNIYDFRAALNAGASAVAAGTMFIFHGKHRAVLISYPSQDELESVLSH